MSFLLFKVAKFIGVIILATWLFVAMLPDGDARSLAVTGATQAGTASDIVLTDMIPAFFGQISSKA